MIETTIVTHDPAEIEIVADALQRIAELRRSSEVKTAAETNTITVTDPPKRRGRPPKSATPEPAPEPAPEVDLTEVRARLGQIAAAGKSAAVKDLLAEFGAAKLTDIEPHRYPALLEKASQL